MTAYGFASVRSQLVGIDSSSAFRPPVPACEKNEAAEMGCEDGGLSSVIPCVLPEVIAM